MNSLRCPVCVKTYVNKGSLRDHKDHSHLGNQCLWEGCDHFCLPNEDDEAMVDHLITHNDQERWKKPDVQGSHWCHFPGCNHTMSYDSEGTLKRHLKRRQKKALDALAASAPAPPAAAPGPVPGHQGSAAPGQSAPPPTAAPAPDRQALRLNVLASAGFLLSGAEDENLNRNSPEGIANAGVDAFLRRINESSSGLTQALSLIREGDHAAAVDLITSAIASVYELDVAITSAQEDIMEEND
ncbi:hypothetical protein F4779DRAFT_615203 [Xylariaceae sp. FL0662B]|nr:hypothetical protein F4779DRAFT_615203 [Xylariaceae sp. FL0662B]